MKKIKNFFIDMVSDTSGHINSKIVMGILSFVVASILAFLGAETTYVAYFLAFSAGSLGFSCFDNNSAFKFQKIENKTETKDTKIDIEGNVEKVIEKVKEKNG